MVGQCRFPKAKTVPATKSDDARGKPSSPTAAAYTIALNMTNHALREIAASFLLMLALGRPEDIVVRGGPSAPINEATAITAMPASVAYGHSCTSQLPADPSISKVRQGGNASTTSTNQASASRASARDTSRWRTPAGLDAR